MWCGQHGLAARELQRVVDATATFSGWWSKGVGRPAEGRGQRAEGRHGVSKVVSDCGHSSRGVCRRLQRRPSSRVPCGAWDAGAGQPQNIRPTFHPSAISGGEGRPRQLTVAGRDFLLRPSAYPSKCLRGQKAAGSGFGSARQAGMYLVT